MSAPRRSRQWRGPDPVIPSRNLKKLWAPRLSAQMVDLPEFTEVYRAVRRALRQAGLAGK